jgi:hypothetical protein
MNNRLTKRDREKITALTTTLQGVKRLAEVMVIVLSKINDWDNSDGPQEGNIHACRGIGTLLEAALEIHGIPAIVPIFREVSNQWLEQNPNSWIFFDSIADNLNASERQKQDALDRFGVEIEALGSSPEWLEAIGDDVEEYYTGWPRVTDEVVAAFDWASEGF